MKIAIKLEEEKEAINPYACYDQELELGELKKENVRTPTKDKAEKTSISKSTPIKEKLSSEFTESVVDEDELRDEVKMFEPLRRMQSDLFTFSALRK